MSGRTIKILSIDGGGIRGLIPAIIIGEIERRTGHPAAHLFDFIAGTSTGAIVSLGLTQANAVGYPSHTAEEIALLYSREGNTIFKRSVWRQVSAVGNITTSKYSAVGFEGLLKRFWRDTKLSQAITDVLVVSYEIKQRDPWLFRSYQAKQAPAPDFLMRDVIRATTAAPTFFDLAQLRIDDAADVLTFIDGGFVANNPSMVAYIEARELYPQADDFLIVSLGTGEVQLSIDIGEAKEWGLAGWAPHVVDVFFDAQSSVVDYQMRHLLPPHPDGHPRYFRIQAPLHGVNNEFDDASEGNLQNIREFADGLLRQYDSMVDQIAEILLA